MAKNTETEKDFIWQLAQQRQATNTQADSNAAGGATVAPRMKLNAPPVSKGISAEQLYQDEQNKAKEKEQSAENRASSLVNSLPVLAQYRKLDLNLIDDSPYQPRRFYEPAKLDKLGESMRAAGLAEPIVVRVNGDRYELIAGHRRTRAARNIGWTEIDARIIICTDLEAEKIALVHNEGKVGLTDYERAHLYHRALEHGIAKNQTEAAAMFSVNQSTVSYCLKMLTFPSEILVYLDKNPGLIRIAQAREIFKLLEEFPAETALIAEAVGRMAELADNRDEDDDEDRFNIKTWVLQKIAARKPLKRPARHLIPDRSGKALFSTRTSEKEVIIKLEDGSLDAETVQKWINAALRERAEKVNVE